LTILDKYIIKKFLSTFVFALVLFFVISIVIDLVERIDDFINCEASVGTIITNYYLPFIPWIGAILFPLFVFISVLFFTSKLASQSEIIALLGNGVSYYRIIVPYMVTALFLASMLYLGNHYLVPWSNAKKLAFENTYFSHGYKASAQNIHMRLSPNEFIYLENYNHHENEGYKFAYEKFNKGLLVYKVKCDRLEWNYKHKNWTLHNCTVRTYDGKNESMTKMPKMEENYKIVPGDFILKAEIKEAMTTPQLNEFLIQEESRGADNLERFYVERLRRTAACFSLLIMTLIGIAVAARKSRGGTGVPIAVGLILSAAYILFMQMSTTFSNQAGLNPYLGTWMPNILFTIIAVFLIIKAQK